MDKIANFINGKDLVAHNVNFDLKFLNNILGDKDIEINAIDSLSLIRKKISLEKYSLDYLKKYFNLNHTNHRAYDDCLIVNDILKKVVK